MPEIVFTVDENGATSMKIKGLRGRKACQPIHDSFSADLSKIGIGELSAEVTDEGRLPPPTYTNQQTVRSR